MRYILILMMLFQVTPVFAKPEPGEMISETSDAKMYFKAETQAGYWFTTVYNPPLSGSSGLIDRNVALHIAECTSERIKLIYLISYYKGKVVIYNNTPPDVWDIVVPNTPREAVYKTICSP